MSKQTVEIDSERVAAVQLLRRGLITQAEAARLAGKTRQVVQHWVNMDEVDVWKAREAYLRKLWRDILDVRR